MSFPRFRDDTTDPDQFRDPVTDPPFSTPYIYSVFLPIARSGSSIESDRQQRDLVELETQVNAKFIFFLDTVFIQKVALCLLFALSFDSIMHGLTNSERAICHHENITATVNPHIPY